MIFLLTRAWKSTFTRSSRARSIALGSAVNGAKAYDCLPPPQSFLGKTIRLVTPQNCLKYKAKRSDWSSVGMEFQIFMLKLAIGYSPNLFLPSQVLIGQNDHAIDHVIGFSSIKEGIPNIYAKACDWLLPKFIFTIPSSDWSE